MSCSWETSLPSSITGKILNNLLSFLSIPAKQEEHLNVFSEIDYVVITDVLTSYSTPDNWEILPDVEWKIEGNIKKYK